MNEKVKVGIIGSQFISTVHAGSLQRCQAAETVAVASPTPGNAEKLAAQHGIHRHFKDYRDLLAMDEIDMVAIGIPKDLHCEGKEKFCVFTITAAAQEGWIKQPFSPRLRRS